LTEVRCKVSSCYYWGNGDVCKADTIMVDNDTGSTGRGVRMEAGDLSINTRNDAQSDIRKSGTDVHSGSHSTNQARTSSETICSTFRPKGTQPRH